MVSSERSGAAVRHIVVTDDGRQILEMPFEQAKKWLDRGMIAVREVTIDITYYLANRERLRHSLDNLPYLSEVDAAMLDKVGNTVH